MSRTARMTNVVSNAHDMEVWLLETSGRQPHVKTYATAGLGLFAYVVEGPATWGRILTIPHAEPEGELLNDCIRVESIDDIPMPIPKSDVTKEIIQG